MAASGPKVVGLGGPLQEKDDTLKLLGMGIRYCALIDNSISSLSFKYITNSGDFYGPSK